MEWRDGKLHITAEDCADYMADLAEGAAIDERSRENLRAAARDGYAHAADPSKPMPRVNAQFSQIAAVRLMEDRIGHAR